MLETADNLETDIASNELFEDILDLISLAEEDADESED